MGPLGPRNPPPHHNFRSVGRPFYSKLQHMRRIPFYAKHTIWYLIRQLYTIRYIHDILMMRGHNTCAWLRVAEDRLCGRSCCQKYCKVHLAIIRKGRKISTPCRICGKCVQSAIELGQTCGRGKVWLRHVRLEKKARSMFDDVMCELLHIVPTI